VAEAIHPHMCNMPSTTISRQNDKPTLTNIRITS